MMRNVLVMIIRISAHVLAGIIHGRNAKMMLWQYSKLISISPKPRISLNKGQYASAIALIFLMAKGKPSFSAKTVLNTTKENFSDFVDGIDDSVSMNLIKAIRDHKWHSSYEITDEFREAIEQLIYFFVDEGKDEGVYAKEFIDVISYVYYSTGINPVLSILSLCGTEPFRKDLLREQKRALSNSEKV